MVQRIRAVVDSKCCVDVSSQEYPQHTDVMIELLGCTYTCSFTSWCLNHNLKSLKCKKTLRFFFLLNNTNLSYWMIVCSIFPWQKKYRVLCIPILKLCWYIIKKFDFVILEHVHPNYYIFNDSPSNSYCHREKEIGWLPKTCMSNNGQTLPIYGKIFAAQQIKQRHTGLETNFNCCCFNSQISAQKITSLYCTQLMELDDGMKFLVALC